MPQRSSKLDLNQLAKRIVDEATGVEPITQSPGKSLEDISSIRRKGGKARAEKLTPEQRSEIAKKAAAKRWNITQPSDVSRDSAKLRKSRGVIRPPAE